MSSDKSNAWKPRILATFVRIVIDSRSKRAIRGEVIRGRGIELNLILMLFLLLGKCQRRATKAIQAILCLRATLVFIFILLNARANF